MSAMLHFAKHTSFILSPHFLRRKSSLITAILPQKKNTKIAQAMRVLA
jgi:hypothetical protein